jgi:hypothetical protein
MPDSAVCDHCSGPIEKGGGFVFYSTAAGGMPGMLQETGNMMLCDRCANEIVSAAGYGKTLPAQREITGADLLADPMIMLKMMKEHNAASIVKLCKTHGFTPEQAKAKARELAQKWWDDPNNAQLESAAFWKSGRQSQSQHGHSAGCAVAIVAFANAVSILVLGTVLWWMG